MKDWQERVVEEKAELDKKIEKLSKFIQGGEFWGLAMEEQRRLLTQITLMQQYSEVLGERIDAFEVNDKGDEDG